MTNYKTFYLGTNYHARTITFTQVKQLEFKRSWEGSSAFNRWLVVMAKIISPTRGIEHITMLTQWKLASLIHSRRPSQEGLRECPKPSDRSGCYFILPSRWSKIQDNIDSLEVNVPQ